VYRVLMGKPEGKSHLKYQGVDGRMGSKWTLGRLVGRCVEWIHLAQDRDRLRAVVNAVMNPRVLAPHSCCDTKLENRKLERKLVFVQFVP
jgi:hypothetical protein